MENEKWPQTLERYNKFSATFSKNIIDLKKMTSVTLETVLYSGQSIYL